MDSSKSQVTFILLKKIVLNAELSSNIALCLK